MESVSSNIERLKNSSRISSDNIRALKNKKTEKLSAFGNSMHLVMKDIYAAEQAGRWRGKKPVGPIGNFASFISKELMLK